MARFREIIIILKECVIPDVICTIAASYGDMTDEERTVYLLQKNNGEIKLWDSSFSCSLGLRFHFKEKNIIVISDGGASRKNHQKTTRAISCFIRTRTWKVWFKNGNKYGHHRVEQLASIWQKIHDMWIIL